MVGGGNYIEYQNLQDYCKRQQGAKKITYGTSELMNAQQFLTQVTTYYNTILSNCPTFRGTVLIFGSKFPTVPLFRYFFGSTFEH